ncbi:MAG: TonB-dependent receptor [Microscillaceae bacterium]|nr:TonB-dependent receptor [Microscillaceae bacterium]MDW8461770.1 TonB-dependent receptor [Cytophagales bacterium]
MNQHFIFGITFFYLWLSSQILFAQAMGVVQGEVRDKNGQFGLAGVSIVAEGTQIGVSTDAEGKFKLSLPVGSYNIKATLVGYKPIVKYNINVTSGNANIISFELEEDNTTLGEVEVTADKTISPAVADIFTPLSVQSLTTEEIRSNPGGNFDISRVVQVLPGVGGTNGSVGGFRNDIIIRGGAPNENVYYLDGIEIPVINHFATQGAAGGPTGILNVSFIEDVKLSSSAFEARYDNALASVFQFKQREGNPDRFQGNVRLSATELANTLEIPIGKKTTSLLSARRSYLQFLFEAIDLPIRPDYWDFQYKITHKLNAKTTINAIGVGAIDEFRFGSVRKSTPENEYILRSVPSIQQWNYTVGFLVKRLIKNGFVNIALSRNMFDNQIDRFEDKQVGNENFRILGIQSQEIENKLRVEINKSINGWKYAYGLVGQYVKFNNRLFNRIRKEITDGQGNIVQSALLVRANSAIEFFRYGAFVQGAKALFKDKLGLSAGLRTDMNSFTTTGNNPLETLSPRASITYSFSDKWSASASIGSYFKIPVYTILGFRNEQGELVNRNVRYTNSIHYTTGVEFLPKNDLRFTLEVFYKDYRNYPVSIRDGISLANQGGDFSPVGNEAVQTTGKGRAYGLEFYLQQKLTKNTFAVFSYTLVRSEFAGLNNIFIPSAWDNRHLISALYGRKFRRGWELGLRYRFAGGAPFTPFDLVASQRNYASLGVGILDFSRLNSQRLDAFNQLDVRIDKKWNFKNFTFDLFLDVVNFLRFPTPAFPQYTFQRTSDNTAFATTDGLPLAADGSNAIPLILKNNDAIFVPSIGFIIEF